MKQRITIVALVVTPFVAVSSLIIATMIGLHGASSVPDLHSAAASGDLQRVRELVASGASVDMQITDRWETYEGQTALMWAALHGRLEVVQFLLQNGANPSIPDASGQTARDYAEMSGDDTVVELLESAEEQ